MKTGLHPEYHQITIACGCGTSFQIGSTHKGDMRVEICANCHPLYTGKSNLIDAAGRLDKFQARQKQAEELKLAAKIRTDKRTARESAAEETATEKK